MLRVSQHWQAKTIRFSNVGEAGGVWIPFRSCDGICFGFACTARIPGTAMCARNAEAREDDHRLTGQTNQEMARLGFILTRSCSVQGRDDNDAATKKETTVSDSQ